MGEWQLTLRHQAANRQDAEDWAASIMEAIGNPRGAWASGLYYHDPVTGTWKVWAEPAMTKSELKMRREPL